MNGIEKKVVEYLERANLVMNHCRQDLVMEREYINDTAARIEIAKLLQQEEQFKLKLAIEHSGGEIDPKEIFKELGYVEMPKEPTANE